jgi:hypothetical protein
MNKFFIGIGDTLNNNNGRYDKFLVESNKSIDEIQKAYRLGTKILGIDFITLFERNAYIQQETLEPLFKAGYKKNKLNIEDKYIYFTTDMYLDVFEFIVKLGHPEITITLIDNFDQLSIGGSGLYQY